MREHFYYFDYLKADFPQEYLDSIKFELDKRIYYYGDQFLNNLEKSNKYSVIRDVRRNLVDFYKLIRDSKFSIGHNKDYAISGAYFGLDSYLMSSGIGSVKMPWSGLECSSWSQYRKLRNYQTYLGSADLLTLLSKDAISRYNETLKVLRSIYSQSYVKYLCIPQDMSPFENISVKLFNELGKKSFVFLHGLPGRYNNIDDNRADYLVVWGEAIRKRYIEAGIDANKIFISGHPRYGSYSLANIKLRMGLENILVISKSMNGGQHSDAVRLTDRGNMLLYLWKIQNALTKLGVKSVRFRPHPSEDVHWYYKFIDKNFFLIDTETNINSSLKKSNLVIGPTSSVLIDAIFSGVNYIVFEPALQGFDLINFPLVPPFDRSDSRVVVAQTEDELISTLVNRKLIDVEVIEDYVQPKFDLSFMQDLINIK